MGRSYFQKLKIKKRQIEKLTATLLSDQMSIKYWRNEGRKKQTKVIGSNHELKKREIKGVFFLRLKLGNCVFYFIIFKRLHVHAACQWKKKKKEKERKKTLPLFAENTTANVNKNKEDKLPWFCTDLLHKVLLSCWYDDKSTLFEEKLRIRNIEKWIEPFQHLGSCCWFLLYPFMSFQSLRGKINVERSDFS